MDTKALIASLPEEPGIYRMIGSGDVVLYVGKAKNIKKRVSSYFQRTLASPRIALMVAQIERVETTVTRSEAEALILENNLIKALSPKYNIIFRDDKSYPYIEISADQFPRIAFHRGGFTKGARYFGPFPGAAAVRESLQLLQKVFLLRTCENVVFQNRSRPCLLHQIHRCTAPCVGLIDEASYGADVRLAEMLLSGRHNEVLDRLTEDMQRASTELKFERAAMFRDAIRSLQSVLHRQFMSSAKDQDVDIVVAIEEAGVCCVNHAMVRGGRHLGDKSHFPQHADDCGALESLQAFLEQHYADHPMPGRILINLDVSTVFREDWESVVGSQIPIIIARTEMERAWVSLAEKNARHAIAARHQSNTSSMRRLSALREALGFSHEAILNRIECFDVSHTQGEATVASCVVFCDGRMKKSEYRRYNITGITPGDDYAAMRQVFYRRYEKVAKGEGIKPDLILVDGGKGQLSAAREILQELNLFHISAVGVAKGEGRKVGLEALILPTSDEPLKLCSDDPGLHLVQEIRDEAHRFALAGHQAQRAKKRSRSRLEDIPGVGPARRKRLLAQFGGVQGVIAATIEDLCRIDGISRRLAEEIYNRLH